jgi:hypothetical protein
LGPPQHGRRASRIQGRRRPRRRRCLLKGCAQWFQPKHPQARYCSAACRQAARRWRVWRARQRYGATERGKACRRDQSRRYRERVRQRGRCRCAVEAAASAGSCACHREYRPEAQAAGSGVPAGREGQRPAILFKKSSCARPGCYICFDPDPRSPLKRFCSSLCRRALQRVLEREAHWRWGCFRRRIEHDSA